MKATAYFKRVEERDALAKAAAKLLTQLDEGPRACSGRDSGGHVDWKGTMHERIEALRALVHENEHPTTV